MMTLSSLISDRVPGRSLPQAFYRSPDVFDADMVAMSSRWHLAGHASELASSGDWITTEIGRDSYVVTRDTDGEVRAFHNVCRHRGSRVCLDKSGHDKLLVCPYHAWSYRLDGSLRAARDTPEGFDSSTLGLYEIGVRVLEGLVFVSPLGDPAAFDAEFADAREMLAFHGLTHAKVAARRSYPTVANWKLVVENFLECYHCAPSHPEYSAVHSRAKLDAFGAGPGSSDPEAVERFRPVLEAWEAKCRTLGHPLPFVEGGAETDHMIQLARFPISDDVDSVSETRTGAPASSVLMGSFEQTDAGQTAFASTPNSYVLANCDFVFVLVFRPVSAVASVAEALWLVDADATEGVDYDVDDLMWVWDTTLRQDKTIVENNQLGVDSSGYQPGPYMTSEARVDTFVEWYLRLLDETLPKQRLDAPITA